MRISEAVHLAVC